jgi:hypothetical protein
MTTALPTANVAANSGVIPSPNPYTAADELAPPPLQSPKQAHIWDVWFNDLYRKYKDVSKSPGPAGADGAPGLPGSDGAAGPPGPAGADGNSLPVTKSATNLASGWYRIATAPAGSNVGLFRIVHRGRTQTSTLVFALTQAQGSTEPNVNILAADISDR